MKKLLLSCRLRQWVLGGLLLGAGLPARAQTVASYFRPAAGAARLATTSPSAKQLRQYRAYTLDLAGLRRSLSGARLRGAGAPLTVLLPLPDGTSQRFAVWEAPLLAPALAARTPNVHTYGGQGLDDRSAHLSLTVSPTGVLAQVLTDQPTGAVYLEAASKDDAQHIISYYAADVLPPTASPGACGTTTLPKVPQPPAARPGGGPSAPGARTNASTVGYVAPPSVLRRILTAWQFTAELLVPTPFQLTVWVEPATHLAPVLGASTAKGVLLAALTVRVTRLLSVTPPTMPLAVAL